jgi:hypothetical protein
MHFDEDVVPIGGNSTFGSQLSHYIANRNGERFSSFGGHTGPLKRPGIPWSFDIGGRVLRRGELVPVEPVFQVPDSRHGGLGVGIPATTSSSSSHHIDPMAQLLRRKNKSELRILLALTNCN